MSGDLDSVALFSELSPEQRETLLEFLEAREVYSGHSLFRCGDESGELIVLLEGGVRIEVDRKDAGTLDSGSVLGATCLARMGSRECSAIALADLRVLELSRTAYLRLRDDYPTIALAVQEAIVRQLSNDVRELLQRA